MAILCFCFVLILKTDMPKAFKRLTHPKALHRLKPMFSGQRVLNGLGALRSARKNCSFWDVPLWTKPITISSSYRDIECIIDMLSARPWIV